MSLLANYPFFFDAPEYIALSRLPIAEALRVVHPLAHPVSMLMWRLTYLGFGPSVTVLSLVSAVLWVFGVIAAARCVASEKRWIVCTVGCLLPLPWLVMTNVGVDSVSSSLFMIGVACIWARRDWGRVIMATGIFSLAIFNYLGMAVWLVVPIVVIGLDQKLSWKSRVGMTAVVMTSAMIGMGALLLMGLWTTKVGVGLAPVPVAIYHAGVAFVANYTWVSVIVVAGFALRWFLRREWVKLTIMATIMAVYVVSLVPWHSGPYGRLGLFVVYPLAWLFSRLPKWIGVLAVILIFPTWLMTVKAYQGNPLPLSEQKLIEGSPCRENQLVLSEIQRPQLSSIYPTAWYVGPVNWQEVAAGITLAVQAGETICISRQAMDYPYRQYEGQLPYPLSGVRNSRGFLYEVLQDRLVMVAGEDAKHPELTIYTVSR